MGRNALLDLYFKIILPSLLYGLVLWGGCPYSHFLHSLEILSRRAARIAYNLPCDMYTKGVYRLSNWSTLTFYCKLPLIKILHIPLIGEAPAGLSYMTNKPCSAHNFRSSNTMIVPRFRAHFLKNSFSYRGVILWSAAKIHHHRSVYCLLSQGEEGLLFQGT